MAAPSGFRVRIRRVQDNVVIYDSELAVQECNVHVADLPGAGAWSYVLELQRVQGTGAALFTNRNTISGVALNR